MSPKAIAALEKTEMECRVDRWIEKHRVIK